MAVLKHFLIFDGNSSHKASVYLFSVGASPLFQNYIYVDDVDDDEVNKSKEFENHDDYDDDTPRHPHDKMGIIRGSINQYGGID